MPLQPSLFFSAAERPSSPGSGALPPFCNGQRGPACRCPVLLPHFGTEPDSHRSRVRSRKRRDFLAFSRNRPLFNPQASLACLFSAPTRVFSPSRLVSSPSGSCRKPNPPPHVVRLSRYSSAPAKHSSESVVSSSIPWRIPFAVWCAEARKPQAPASTGPPAMAATAGEEEPGRPPPKPPGGDLSHRIGHQRLQTQLTLSPAFMLKSPWIILQITPRSLAPRAGLRFPNSESVFSVG